jgi:hypothetical protein
MEAQTYVLESTEQRLVETYYHIDLLKRWMTDMEKEVIELKRARNLRDQLKIVREKVQNSRARMESLKNSSQAFLSEYGEFVYLTETIGDKLLLIMLNLYFFNLFRGIQVNFSKSFLDGQVLDFTDVFPVGAVSPRIEFIWPTNLAWRCRFLCLFFITMS